MEAPIDGGDDAKGSRGSNSRGGQPKGRRGGNRGRGGGGGGGGQKKQQEVPATSSAKDIAAIARPQAPPAEDTPEDESLCFICANVVAHHSIAPCNHTTCHICGLRMRALYKDKNCAHCRTPAPFVIFASDDFKKFEAYSEAEFTTTDSNIGIKYANEDIVGDTVLLLRYNCPDPDCDFAGLGWPDLHRHVKSAHKKRMCDLCTRNKRLFTHEHELFTDKELERHMKRGDDQPGAADQTGFKGHPLCGFCGERFYDDDKLYEHCRMKHERCFICDRRDSRQPHYFLDYPALEKHFSKDHFLCSDRECMDKKFVVFESEMDLQAHQLSDHGGKAGTRSVVVDISGFHVRAPYQDEQRRGGGRGREGRSGRGRGRDQNAETAPLPSTQPLNRAELAFQRQMAIHSAQSVTNRSFGGQLSAPAQTTPSASRPPSGTSTPRPAPDPQSTPLDPATMTPEDRARHVRHSTVIERASNLLHADPQKLASFRSHISSYRSGSLTAPQLVDAFLSLFSSTSLGTLVREVAELFEDKAKGEALRQAWMDWRAINEDYPSLPGLSGMQGETSSSSGWATAGSAGPANPGGKPGQKFSNRVLKLKNSTRLGGPAPVSAAAPSWKAAPAVQAPSQSAFPALPSSSSSVRTTPAPAPLPSNTISRPRPKASGENFPALPAAPKPTTTIWGYGNGRGVIRDTGKKDTGFQWGGEASSSAAAPVEEPEQGGRKGKGKKKVLVQWG